MSLLNLLDKMIYLFLYELELVWNCCALVHYWTVNILKTTFPSLHLYDIHQVYNMPGGCTKFSRAWLDQVDDNGHILRQWCTTDSSSLYNGYCTLCKKPVSCENIGLLQLKQHAKSSKHKAIAEATFSRKTSCLQESNSTDSTRSKCWSWTT